MKKVSPKEALEKAYQNLYTCEIKKIGKNLDALIKAKKFYAKNVLNDKTK